MKLVVDCFESLLIDMRIDLRRRNIGVTEHFLNNPQVRAIAEEMCGE